MSANPPYLAVVVVAVLLLVAGCAETTGSFGESESSRLTATTETTPPGANLAPPDRKTLQPKADSTTAPSDATPHPETAATLTTASGSPDDGARTHEGQAAESTPTAGSTLEVLPIHDEATHPGDPGESSITFEAGKTIHADAIAAQLAQNVNDTRRTNGYPTLEWHEPAASTGRAHAADMFRREYFAHENPEGERAWDRYAKTGYEACAAYGENNYRMTLGYNHSRYEEMSSSDIERYLAGRINTGFRRSNEGHRELMLDPQYTHLGVSVYLGTDGDDESRVGRPYEIYVVEQFCTPERLRSVAVERLQTYDEPRPKPGLDPTPVPVTATPTVTPPPTAATPTPTAAATSTPTDSSGDNTSPTIQTQSDGAGNEVTVVVEWGDAYGLGVVFEDSDRWTVLRKANGDSFVLSDVSAGDRVHVTAFYPDGGEEKLGWFEL